MANAVLRNKIFSNQVVRFAFSGGTGAIVDVLAFRVLHLYVFENKSYQVFKIYFSNYSLSLVISFFTGVIVNFLITRYLVFTESKSKSSKQFARFISVAIVGYFANLALIEIFMKSFEMKPDIARITAIFSLFFASFFIHKFFSFSLSLRHHHATGADSETSN